MVKQRCMGEYFSKPHVPYQISLNTKSLLQKEIIYSYYMQEKQPHTYTCKQVSHSSRSNHHDVRHYQVVCSLCFFCRWMSSGYLWSNVVMKSYSIWFVPLSCTEIVYPTLQEVILHQADLLHAALTQGIRNKRLLLEPFLRPTAMMDSEQERT